MSDEIVQEWLERGRADLNAAWNCVHGPRDALTVAPYHVQQAAEKLTKAVLIAEGIDPPHTHDSGTLAALVRSYAWRDRCAGLARFTVYTTAFRYPGEEPAEAIPTPSDIEAWIGELEHLKRDFEAWLTDRGEGG